MSEIIFNVENIIVPENASLNEIIKLLNLMNLTVTKGSPECKPLKDMGMLKESEK